MHSRTLAGALAAALLLACARPAVAADATLLRVFLTDGTSLVSYGELARVGDRVFVEATRVLTFAEERE